jgi:oligopeptidase B
MKATIFTVTNARLHALAPMLLALLLAACGHVESTSPPPAARAEAPKATIAPADVRVPQPPLVTVRDGLYEPTPPVAALHDHEIVAPGGTRNDPYYWLRDDTRKNPAMLAHLTAERDYYEAMMAPLAGARTALYEEIVGRIAKDDNSVPERKNGWWYSVRFVSGGEYPVYVRRRDAPDAPEEILLDGNAMAKGHDYFQIADTQVSVDGKRLAWLEDTVGRRQFTLRFKDLTTGRVLDDRIENVDGGGIVWANDNRTVLYVEKDPVTLLGFKVRKHKLGDASVRDPLVYEEKDRSFYLGVGKTRSDRFVTIYVASTVSSEQRFADANDPKLEFRVLVPRERDHEYQAEDFGDTWILRTNWQAKNFRVVSASTKNPADRAAWKDIVPARATAFVDDTKVFRDHLAVSERENGLRQIRILRWADNRQTVIAADEPTYTAIPDDNPETDTAVVRYYYTSLTTPGTIYDYDMNSGERTLRKRDPVLGNFEPANYASEYVHATARDGTKIPVSIVYRKGTPRDGTAALYQTGYGSYGASSDPMFSAARLSLLDRGVVVAIAHIRGGQELGRDWYEHGRRLEKKNTFTDFIDVTDFLVREGYAAKDRVIAQGGSAGGLLMGAIANMAPEKYRVILAGVPFVDVVTTMLDHSIPLTTNEFDEWGDPADPQYYEYILSYSPYDNVAEQDYPAMLVSTGLWDSQVQYYEPAKWVAKLRAMKGDREPLLFRINMDAGHGGKSGRYRRFEQTADEYAFAMDQVRIALPGAKMPEKRPPPQ